MGAVLSYGLNLWDSARQSPTTWCHLKRHSLTIQSWKGTLAHLRSPEMAFRPTGHPHIDLYRHRKSDNFDQHKYIPRASLLAEFLGAVWLQIIVHSWGCNTLGLCHYLDCLTLLMRLLLYLSAAPALSVSDWSNPPAGYNVRSFCLKINNRRILFDGFEMETKGFPPPPFPLFHKKILAIRLVHTTCWNSHRWSVCLVHDNLGHVWCWQILCLSLDSVTIWPNGSQPSKFVFPGGSVASRSKGCNHKTNGSAGNLYHTRTARWFNRNWFIGPLPVDTCFMYWNHHRPNYSGADMQRGPYSRRTLPLNASPRVLWILWYCEKGRPLNLFRPLQAFSRNFGKLWQNSPEIKWNFVHQPSSRNRRGASEHSHKTLFQMLLLPCRRNQSQLGRGPCPEYGSHYEHSKHSTVFSLHNAHGSMHARLITLTDFLMTHPTPYKVNHSATVWAHQGIYLNGQSAGNLLALNSSSSNQQKFANQHRAGWSCTPCWWSCHFIYGEPYVRICSKALWTHGKINFLPHFNGPSDHGIQSCQIRPTHFRPPNEPNRFPMFSCTWLWSLFPQLWSFFALSKTQPPCPVHHWGWHRRMAELIIS